MTYDELIPELKTVRYCCHRLIELNQELEVLNHQTTGLAKSGGIELTAEQKRSKWPMRHISISTTAHSVYLKRYQPKNKSCTISRKD